ncbi:MAG: hypothetical protein WD534_01260 [Phycisphaeraceae bacterium]
MGESWKGRFRPGAAGLALAVLAPVAVAQPAEITDVSAGRGVSVNVIAADGLDGFPQNSDSDAISGSTLGAFNEFVEVSAVTPNGTGEGESRAAQVSDITFVTPHRLRITGEMNIANFGRGLTPGGEDDFAEVDHTASTGWGFNMTTDSSVSYSFTGDYAFDFEGSPTGPNQAFLFINADGFLAEDFGGGTGTFDYHWRAPAGEQDVSLALAHGARSLFLPDGGVSAEGRVSFDLIARVAPTPAAVGPGLILLGTLLLRRRRACEPVEA